MMKSIYNMFNINREDFEINFLVFRKHIIRIIIYSFCFFNIFFFLSNKILYILTYPFNSIIENIRNYHVLTSMMINHPLEAIFLKLKTVFIFFFPILLIIFLLEMYVFCKPGLYEKEQKCCTKLLCFLITIISLSFILSIFVFTPIIFRLAASVYISMIKSGINVVFMPKVTEYLDVIFAVFIVLILLCIFPLLIIFLLEKNIIHISYMQKKRSIAFLFAFIIAAVITTPDILSQIVVGLLIYVVYEVIILVYLIKHKKTLLISNNEDKQE